MAPWQLRKWKAARSIWSGPEWRASPQQGPPRPCLMLTPKSHCFPVPRSQHTVLLHCPTHQAPSHPEPHTGLQGLSVEWLSWTIDFRSSLRPALLKPERAHQAPGTALENRL